MSGSSFIDGPGAVASGYVCAQIEVVVTAAVRSAERSARVNGGRVAPDVLEFADAVNKAARLWRASATAARSVAGISERSDDVAPVKVGVVMGTTEVADLLRTTSRNVVALATRGTLHGEKTGRTWTFLTVDVAAYVAKRSAA